MTKKLYRFAGLEFAIEMPEDMMYTSSFRLEPFEVKEVSAPHRFSFSWIDDLPQPEGPRLTEHPYIWICAGKNSTVRYFGAAGNDWRNANIRVEDTGMEHSILVKRSPIPKRMNSAVVLELLNLEHLVTQCRGVILHCAFIEYGGKAILFTAPSETGKTTQAELWKKYLGAEIINGDRAVIRVDQHGVTAEGLPMCGGSGYCENRILPLEAVVYLEQAPVTTIRRLRGYEAFAKLWEGINSVAWDKTDVLRASEVTEAIANRVPIYHMPCTPDEQAVRVLEKTLRKQESV